MSHNIDGFIGDFKHLDTLCESYAYLTVCPCDSNFGFIPITDEFYDNLMRTYKPQDGLCPTCQQEIRYDPIELFGKKHEPIAYIKTDYFGGCGEQLATLWLNGVKKYFREHDAIDKALQALGVKAVGNKDEFDTVGLGKHRSNDSWLGRDY